MKAALIQQKRKNDNKHYFEVAPGVWGSKIVFVNIYMISKQPFSTEWVLVDAALKTSAKKIIKMAEDIFGVGTHPSAIVLTHGHFDHVGALKDLLEIWDVPVFAHHLEIPYLTGLSSYPPPDPTVGGGLMSSLSWMYPKGPSNLGGQISELPADGSVPLLPGWKYFHTPGHAPGHVSLFRNEDKVLIAGDAFVTTKQESAFAVMTQKKLLSGPPKYFTNDWIAAETSVRKLAELRPSIAATGHGMPMQGNELLVSLDNLVLNFAKLAIPLHGRYVIQPAIMNEQGVQYVPPQQYDPIARISIFALAALTIFTIFKRINSNQNKIKS
ncbi:MAG: MBL fold metallo-hydrolase [Flavobacterium sp.]|nr:MBL fold metallo-hydrolase [Pedobacter sp.]